MILSTWILSADTLGVTGNSSMTFQMHALYISLYIPTKLCAMTVAKRCMHMCPNHVR